MPVTVQQKVKGLKVGDRVVVEGYDEQGTISFQGTLPASKAKLRTGVTLDKPVGDGDGTWNGHKYFECEQNCGVLVLPKKVSPAPIVVFEVKSPPKPKTNAEFFAAGTQLERDAAKSGESFQTRFENFRTTQEFNARTVAYIYGRTVGGGVFWGLTVNNTREGAAMIESVDPEGPASVGDDIVPGCLLKTINGLSTNGMTVARMEEEMQDTPPNRPLVLQICNPRIVKDKAIFGVLDITGDGSLSLAEMIQVGMDADTFRAIDKDNSGAIDKKEFRAWRKANPEKASALVNIPAEAEFAIDQGKLYEAEPVGFGGADEE